MRRGGRVQQLETPLWATYGPQSLPEAAYTRVRAGLGDPYTAGAPGWVAIGTSAAPSKKTAEAAGRYDIGVGCTLRLSHPYPRIDVRRANSAETGAILLPPAGTVSSSITTLISVACCDWPGGGES